MNDQSDILKRLLHLFPAKALKDEWKTKGKTKDGMAKEIVSQDSQRNILQFAAASFGITKQHVHFFSHEIALSSLPHDVAPQFNLIRRDADSEQVAYFKLIDLPFTVYRAGSGDRLEPVVVTFKWPLKIVYSESVCAIHLTIMERDVAHYMPGSQPVVYAKRGLDEFEVLKMLQETLPAAPYERLDFNKSIKALWAKDFIDARSARFKKAVSTSTEAMDGENLLKKDAHELYKDAIKRPLFRTVFKILKPKDLYPDHFMADPSGGEIAVTTYTGNPDACENLVREILGHN